MLKSSLSRRTWPAWAMLGAGLLATVFASLQVKRDIEQEVVRQFAFVCDQVTFEVRERLDAYALILRGGAAHFAASKGVERDQWRAYVETLRAAGSVPGVQGIGFAQVIPANELATHIAHVRSEGFPDYTVSPPGVRALYTSIIYLEPFRDRNLRAFGYDMFTEPVRRAAMEQARDSGKAALSGKVRLVQETGTDIQAGTLMYVPIYRNGLPSGTLEQKRAALVGWAYSPYRMNDLMTGILRDWDLHEGRAVDLHIYDGLQATPAALLFDSKTAHIPDLHSLFYQQRSIDFNGHQWSLIFDRTLTPSGVNYTGAWAALIGGLALSGLLFGLMLSRINTRTNAVRIANELTEEIKGKSEALSESEANYRRIVENSPDIVYRFSLKKGGIYYSPTVSAVLGYSAEHLCKNPSLWAESIHPDDRAVVAKAIEEFKTGVPFKMQYRVKNAGGDWRWLFDRSIGIREETGDLIVEGLAMDITERKQAEEELRKSEADLRSLIEQSPIAMIVDVGVDADEKIVMMNHQFTELFGYTREDVPDVRHWWRLAYPDEKYRQEIVTSWTGKAEKAIQSHSQIEPMETTVTCKDGSIRYVRFSLASTGSRNIIAFEDLTTGKQNELALARTNRALRTLSACNEALVHAENETELLDAICRLVVDTGGYRMAWVGFPEQNAAKAVRPVAHYGFDEGFLAAAKISWADKEESGRGATGTAMRTGTVQINQYFLTNPALAPWREAALAHGYQSSIGLPLKSAAATLGVLSLYAAAPDAFNATEVTLLQELADDLAFGIETLRTRADRDRVVYEQLHHTEILRQSLEDSIKAIANTVEMRDPYTAGHQRRVGQLAVAIARELGLPEDTTRGIELAASIHDLGKISVPAEILSKPGKLTAIEFMLLKNHAQAGFDILKDIKFPWPIATMVLQHHERQDGSGYPQGLQGEQILLESRIMAVADVVEAMASHRPYRAALGIDPALKEIERGRGTSFDAAVVDACIRVFSEKRFSF